MKLSEFAWFTGLFFVLVALIIDSMFVSVVAILMIFYALSEHITEEREKTTINKTKQRGRK